MIKPFLVKYAKKCVAPARGNTKSKEGYVYDNTVDMVKSVLDDNQTYAIDLTSNTGPMTKKADIEKGEDSKDRMMWA